MDDTGPNNESSAARPGRTTAAAIFKQAEAATTAIVVMGEESASRWHVAGVIAQYWFVSISLVYINKFIVSEQEVEVPIFITWSQVRGATHADINTIQSCHTRNKSVLV